VSAASGRGRRHHGKSLSLRDPGPRTPEIRVAGISGAVPAEQRQKLRGTLLQNHRTQDIHQALADLNVLASGRCAGISRECVTGRLLPTGAAAVMPHAIDDQAEYVPGFIRRHFAAQGVRGFIQKVGRDGKPLPPGWVQMAAKVQRDFRKTGPSLCFTN